MRTVQLQSSLPADTKHTELTAVRERRKLSLELSLDFFSVQAQPKIHSGVETYSLAGRLVNEQCLLRKYALVAGSPLRDQSSRTERSCETRLATCVLV